MSVAYKTGAVASAQNDTVSISATGVAAADLCMVQVEHNEATAAMATPAGWTLLDMRTVSTGTTALRRYVFWRRGGGSFNGTLAGSTIWAAQMVVYSGVTDSGTPFQDVQHTSVDGTTTVTAPSAVVDAATLAVRFFAASSGSTTTNITSPATVRQDNETSFYAGGVSDQAVLSPSSGSSSATVNVSSRVVGTTAILIPENSPPNAPIQLTPVGGAAFDRTLTQRFDWDSSDPDAGDSQSKFDLRYRVVGAATWTDVTGTTLNTYWDAPSATFALGDYEWQVRTYDAQGVVGPYSASEFFTAANGTDAPTITAPMSGGTVDTDPYTVTWSAPSQEAYRVRTVADNAGVPATATVHQDSGEVVSTTARGHSLPFPINGRYEHVQVQIRLNGLWSSWASHRVNVSYTPPETPTVSTTVSDTGGSMWFTVTNPTPSAGVPTTAHNDIYVRETGDPAVSFRLATAQAINSTTTWWLPRSGVDYEVQAVAVGDNGTTAASAWSGAALAAVDGFYGGGY